MKKVFTLMHPKNPPARLMDKVKFDVKKYIKRERNKNLPEGIDYWDFDCKIGATADVAEVIGLKEIGASLDKVLEENLESFYLEIMVRGEVKPVREEKEETDEVVSAEVEE
ncbi:DUF6172 family protein [Fibrobacterales bacterium]|nr:DUF6172 family protein [Fibrobacterales bacterium]